MSLDAYRFKEQTGEAGQPLVFTFHGTGGNETQFFDLAAALVPGAHVISPRGDVSEHGALRFFARKAEGVYDMEDLALRLTAMADFVRGHKERVGATAVVGLGYSNGANILLAVALAHPDLFSDIVAFHPLIPWQPEPHTGLRDKRILLTAGERDPICPAPLTRQLDDWLRSQHAAVELVWHDGGHELRESEIAAAQRFLADTTGKIAIS
jgi:phospholipase/carboxylesterase